MNLVVEINRILTWNFCFKGKTAKKYEVIPAAGNFNCFKCRVNQVKEYLWRNEILHQALVSNSTNHQLKGLPHINKQNM